MDRYNPESKCPKCGHDVVSTQFVAGWDIELDAIQRICQRCRYSWTEEPLDNEVKK